MAKVTTLNAAQVKLLEKIERQGVVDSMRLYRSEIAIAAGLARRGLLVRGTGFGVTYRLAK